ncbi:hypothetical protein [Erythrobacter sp.]|uniref:hypothetical protein n=1 Tax=Erythrobacter sp. TaxID=1042 RepID=UPI001425E9BD|nr:hypothetical protein [Erythrobacter sp.]QIQ85344.1 MAG: hypothetical protein G9473_00590 [Erythrobacter sp.]
MGTRASLLAGAKAAFLGALVGTSLPTLLMVVVLAGSVAADPGPVLIAMLLPFGTGFLAAAVGMVVLGWPLTAWLHRAGRESRRAYVVTGLTAGALPTGALAHVLFGEFLLMSAVIAAFGALTGGATAHFWWSGARKDRAMVHAPTLEAIFD